MRSKIKFDIDEQGSPVISGTIDRTSDDVRDKLANRFFESQKGRHLMLYVQDSDSNGSSVNFVVVPQDLKDKLEQMYERYNLVLQNEDGCKAINEFYEAIIGTTPFWVLKGQ